jgi:signal transduction histidine kinase/archaellum component FlaF (FlaF/FlaG flagellin family)
MKILNFSMNALYWKVSAILMMVLALLGVGYLFISSFTAQRYLQEANQQLYGDVAGHMVKETQPIVNGKVDTAATHDIMHSMMVINRSVEVYLLDPEGTIIDYVVPFETVEQKAIDLNPVKQFIAEGGQYFILGDDPKTTGEQKAFSAAPIYDKGQLAGYAYIILASEQQDAVLSHIFGSYMLKTGTWMFFLALIVALSIGLVAIAYLTRHLNQIIKTAHRFKEGDYGVRVPDHTDGGLAILREAFNEMAATLESNIEELKAVDRLRQELIANVSHDLRTPLSLTQGYLETLTMKEKTLSSADRQSYLKIAYDSSERLGRLVDQLFEYSKLEARQVHPDKQPFLLAELLQDVSVRYQIIAAERKLDIALEVEERVPLVYADISLVERAIQNLLDNAIKFTPDGGQIRMQLSNQPEGVEVRISDTGPGIPEQEQSQIFERYRQVGKEPYQRKKGVGLGLAIVKKIMDLHEATIRVQSWPDRGTAFWFCLPVYQGR